MLKAVLIAVTGIVAPFLTGAAAGGGSPGQRFCSGETIFYDSFERTGDTSRWTGGDVLFTFTESFEGGVFNPAHWSAIPGGGDAVVMVASSVAGVGAASEGTFGVALGQLPLAGISRTNRLDLRLDLSGVENADLSFDVKDTFETDEGQDGLFLSDDGGVSFARIYDFRPGAWVNGSFGRHPPIDLDRLAADRGLVLNDRTVIRWQQHGHGVIGSGDGIFIDNVRVYDPDHYHKGIPYHEDFECGEFSAEWRWATPDDTGIPGTVLPSSIAIVSSTVNGVGVAGEGSFGLALGRLGGGIDVTSAADLHLNLTGSRDAELRFRIADFLDRTNNADGIYVSINGGASFAKIYDFDPGRWNNGVFGRPPPLRLNRYAEEHGLNLGSQVVLRFQQEGFDNFGNDGIAIDSISVAESGVQYVVPPFSEGFESGFSPPWRWADPTFPGETASVESNIPGGIVEAVASVGGVGAARLGFFGVALGRETTGFDTANALDLHLNLAGAAQVQLEFWLKANFGVTDTEDGIFISSDGGENFRKLFDFDPRGMPANVWQQMTLDIDALAAGLGVTLTDRTVLRFQQFGFRGISEGDGLFLDDVSVTLE